MNRLESLRAVPVRKVAVLVLNHAILLAVCLGGDVPYVVLQTLLAIELLLTNVATIALYPERGARRHAFDTIKLAGGLAFILFFVVISYGVVQERGSGHALAVGFAQFSMVNFSNGAAMVGYIVLRLGWSLIQALRSSEPRVAWTKSNLVSGGTTFVAMAFMAFIGLIAGPILFGVASMFDVGVSADALLDVLMVLTRFATAMIGATFSEAEIEAGARQPYVDNTA